MHSFIEDFLRGRVNESFFESNEQYKNMAKEIIEKGIKGKLEEIYGMETTFIIQKNMQAQQILLASIKDKKQL